MTRLLMFVGMTVGGYAGWWAGEYVGFGLMGTLLLSTLGSLAGVYAAWKVLTDYLS
jgi:hypothetical protein